eukprot:55488-Eustigmatos_ZCMA.PRE.1
MEHAVKDSLPRLRLTQPRRRNLIARLITYIPVTGEGPEVSNDKLSGRADHNEPLVKCPVDG